MGYRRVGIGVVVVALVGIAIFWWTRRGEDKPAPPTSTGAQSSGSGGVRIASAPAAEAPARLVVTVTDAKGPVASAAVRLAPDDGDVIVLRTGADGTARTDSLTAGAWRISASAPDHAPAAAKPQKLAAGTETTVALVLPAGGRPLTGTVIDASGGPIAGARVDAAALDIHATAASAIATTLTGPDGKYKLAVPEGLVLVGASSPDYASQARDVEVGAAGAVADFALVPGGAIEGVVRDAKTKELIAGARVDARRDETVSLAEPTHRRATTGADGRFRLAGLRPGAWKLTAVEGSLHTKRATLVGIGVAEQVANLELIVAPGPALRGTIVDEHGALVAGAHVTASSGPEGDSGGATSDGKGAFSLEGLSPGRYYLIASDDAHVPGPATHTVLASEDVTGLVVALAGGSTVRGHVEPRQICDVQLTPARDTESSQMQNLAPMVTGDDGEFSFGPVAGVAVVVEARCPNGSRGQKRAALGAAGADVVVNVAPGGSIAGRVTDGAGAPVAGVTVSASQYGDGDRLTIVNGVVTSGVHAQTDANGAYEITGLETARYHVGALEHGKPMRAHKAAPLVTLGEAEHKTGVDFSVDRATGVIQGTVTDSGGKPIADAWVSVHQDLFGMLSGQASDPNAQLSSISVEMRSEEDGGPSAESDAPPVLTDANGHYEIRNLTHGSFDVVAEAKHGALRGRATKVTPDATADIKAVGVASLSGTVRGPTGAPVAMFTVELDGPTGASRTFTGGAFEIERVDPGAYTVKVTSDEGSGEAKVTVAPETPATVEIVLAANGIVVGRLVDATGKPLADVGVAVAEDHDDGNLQLRFEGPPPRTGADGSFRLEHAAGKVIVVAMTQPIPTQKRGVALVAGKTIDIGTLTAEAPGSGAGPHGPGPRGPGPRGPGPGPGGPAPE